jgi:hypothetical protein
LLLDERCDEFDEYDADEFVLSKRSFGNSFLTRCCGVDVATGILVGKWENDDRGGLGYISTFESRTGTKEGTSLAGEFTSMSESKIQLFGKWKEDSIGDLRDNSCCWK